MVLYHTVVRVAAAAYEALGPELNQIKNEISSLKTDIDRYIDQAVKSAVSKILQFCFPGSTPGFPASSCKEILQLAPQSPSGLYWLRGTKNRPKHMYCDMERSCKGLAGGWMRVASIDMRDDNSTCPAGLKTRTSPRRLCAMNIEDPGCSSALFSVQGIEYSQVCGKISGYQQESPDAFLGVSNTIDTVYVDGISLTHGKNPRKHIWTFAAALDESNTTWTSVCPCTDIRNTPPFPPIPNFVENDYFCDTGSES